MAFAQVGTATTFNNNGSDTTIAITRSVTAGNLLIVTFAWEDFNVTITGVSDGGVNTWVASPVGRVANATQLMYTQTYYVLAAATTASITVTATLSSTADFRSANLAEFSYTGSISYDSSVFTQVTATSLSLTPQPTDSAKTGVLFHAALGSWTPVAATNLGGYIVLASANNSLQCYAAIQDGGFYRLSRWTFTNDSFNCIINVFRENTSATVYKKDKAPPHQSFNDPPLETRSLLNVGAW